MPPYKQANSPNMEKLFSYLRKSQWHNVSANFSGFVRKEYEANMEKLEEDGEAFRNMRLMIEYSEMGRYSEARALIEPAVKEYNDMLDKLEALHVTKGPTRRHNDPPVHSDGTQTERRSNNNSGRRETYTPTRRHVSSPTSRDVRTPDRHVSPSQDHRSQSRHNFQDMTERVPRSPHYHSERPSYDPHLENFDNLGLKSSEKAPYHQQQQQSRYDPPRATSPLDRGSRPGSNRPDQRSSGVMSSANQMTSSKALWGREHGDKQSEKVGSSTYRRDFPIYSVDNPERKDKEMYRDNFGSLADRDLYRDRDDGPPLREETRRSAHQRHTETPDYDHRPSQVARRFRDVYANEWSDAYDEICKDFGSEKTVKHLLWIVTEASLIANDIADRQLHGLERQAFEVMASPGDENEAWAIAMDLAEKQIKDFEKSALCLMTTPGIEHRGGNMPRQWGDTVPTSRSLLQQYRKQTALLSIPYVKEESRDRLSRTLLESCGFPKSYLSDNSRVTAYIYKCAELVWLMCVQDPPIVLQYINRESEGARFNHDHYNVYTKSGNVYDFGVWPMLRQGRNGTVLSKGVAQGM